MNGFLARISHQLSAAAEHLPASAASCSVGLLNDLYKVASGGLGRIPCIRRHLRRLATKAGEKCGLAAALFAVGCVLPMQEKTAVVLEAGEYSLQELVARASAELGINYSSADAEKQSLQRRISFTARQEFSKSEFRLFFEKNLVASGFLLDPVQGLDGKQFRVVDLRGDPRSKAVIRSNAAMVEPKDLEGLDGRAVIVTTTFALKHQDAQRLQSSLRQYLGDTQLEAVFNVGTNSILVTSNPTTALGVAKLIKTVDVPLPEGDPRAQMAPAVSPKRVEALEKRIEELEAKVKALESR